MSLIDAIREGRWVPDGDPPLVTPGWHLTLEQTAERIIAGEEPLFAVRELLDHAGHASPDELSRMLETTPAPTGSDHVDALLGGLGEHLAITRGVPCPAWTSDPVRFLERFWFVSNLPGLRAIALAQTPVALKRRGVMLPTRDLERV